MSYKISPVLTVTATQGPVTGPQLCAMVESLEDYWARGFRTLRHGDCVSGDAIFHCIGKAIGFYVIVHPPENASKRAFMHGDRTEQPLPYLVRNDVMARKCREVLAAPKTEREEQRSGTWATVRYARHHGRPVRFCYPTGAAGKDGQEVAEATSADHIVCSDKMVPASPQTLPGESR